MQESAQRGKIRIFCLTEAFQIVDQIPKDERELLTKDKTFIIPNINEEARMFEWAGVNFGEEETFKLSKSVKVRYITYILKIYRGQLY